MTLLANVVNRVLEVYSRDGKRYGNRQSFQANKKLKKPRYCFKFNSESGCPNSRTTVGCIAPDSKPYRHGCNMKVPPDDKACNSKDHNTKGHK